jgi:hypothetical protein
MYCQVEGFVDLSRSLDTTFLFGVGERRLGLRAQPFSLLTYDYSRIPGIMEQRAGA